MSETEFTCRKHQVDVHLIYPRRLFFVNQVPHFVAGTLQGSTTARSLHCEWQTDNGFHPTGLGWEFDFFFGGLGWKLGIGIV